MTLTFEAREPILVVSDIIKHELDLDDNQVPIYNQAFEIPKKTGFMRVVVAFVSSRVISNNCRTVNASTGLDDEQTLVVSELHQIDVLSDDESARTRKEEILMALAGTYAQQMCEKYHLSIARIPANFNDASELEATRRINRYTMTIAVNAIYRKTQKPEYYDTFPALELGIDKKPEAL